ncbi:hypothetical protein GO013_10390 [Pseudodesulfovibrio sp. JC047]|uniref:rhamnan synthesis F family protein n=1 Tax=Pseudodesulfovibrio sp. JC047 TaxID=2683199 RepID=UPI0013D68F97|nr:rhamnan synthesis F family protein [Pseudodesulfovibrio sp. JC047]NDV19828.1 hypothetical protein [Pseudodesulfovibrio sp. JC047]
MKVVIRRIILSIIGWIPKKYIRMCFGGAIANVLIDDSKLLQLTKDRFYGCYQAVNTHPMTYSKDDSNIVDSASILYQSFQRLDGEKVVLLAHWDPIGIVDDYVLYYAASFKEMGFTVFLCSAHNVKLTSQIKDTFDCVLWRKCDGYDFTSWKAAFDLLPTLYLASQITITNDSIFAPLHPLNDVYSEMRKGGSDFWGLSFSEERCVPHIQSYFVVFNENVVKSQFFKLFWDKIDTQADKQKVIAQNELFLTQWLTGCGFTAGAYVPHTFFNNPMILGPIYLYWKELIRDYNFPAVKRHIFLNQLWWIDTAGWREELQKTGYPANFIESYLHRREKPSD